MARFPLPLGRGQGLLMATLLLSLAGCSTSSQTPTSLSAASPPDAVVQESQPLQVPPQSPRPFKVVMLLDFSGSSSQHRIEMPNVETLQPLLESVSNAGGVIALGAVCNDSNQPFTRLAIAEPPPFPEDELHNATPPTPIDETGVNPLRLPEKQREFDLALAEYSQRMAEDEALIEQHQQAMAAHQSAGQAEIATFSEAIAPLLTRPIDCNYTDLWGGLQRADLLLSEDSSVWSTPPDFYLLVVSDGLDTKGKSEVTLTSNPEILLVNGSGSVGIFADLEHKAFESVDAAIAHLASVRNKAYDPR